MALKLTRDQISPSLEKKIKGLEKLPRDAFTFFQAHTPVRTGNARSRTKLSQQTIVAGYSYAQALDKGASPQAPDGMSKPTRAYIQKQADALLKRK
jgi:hypothetical protein